MIEMAEHWRKATGGLPGAARSVPSPGSQDDIHRFVRGQVQTFLDYRAKSAPRRRAP